MNLAEWAEGLAKHFNRKPEDLDIVDDFVTVHSDLGSMRIKVESEIFISEYSIANSKPDKPQTIPVIRREKTNE